MLNSARLLLVGMRPFLCASTREWKDAVDSLSLEALSWQTAALLQWCGGLWEGDLLLLPSLVCWRELLVALPSTKLVMLSPQTAGARLYKSLPPRHTDAAAALCIMHAYVFLASAYSEMYAQANVAAGECTNFVQREDECSVCVDILACLWC